jgi:hypothetical protein
VKSTHATVTRRAFQRTAGATLDRFNLTNPREIVLSSTLRY